MDEPVARIAESLVVRLYDRSRAARWGLSIARFQAALEASLTHPDLGLGSKEPSVERYLEALYLEDLALAAACAAGQESAWDHFVLEFRPALYRAADAIDPAGGARDLADALFADLFGLRELEGERQSLFRYFHGRSGLATWLRAVLSQRHVDRLRADRRFDPLPEDDSLAIEHAVGAPPDPERVRFITAMRGALSAVIAALKPRDRLRLAYYYAQDLTLAQIGRLLREHEATVSRHLTRTRRAIRKDVEQQLQRQYGFDRSSIAECFRSVVDDAGTLDLGELIGGASGRKILGQDRSR